MKETLEKLIKEAGERMKELQQKYNKLNEEWHREDKERARYTAEVAHGGGFSSDKKNLSQAAEQVKGLVEQLDRVRADIAAQQQYVATLSSQFLDLVRVEKGMQTPASQYSSGVSSNSMFQSNTSTGPRF